ncbi:MAG: hypothetical protein IH892_03655 [Planctomycetes bacterium]|nr:hypothetical protein [Planctomycetota bacterium]
MRFVWRLQRVLDIKEKVEKVQEAALLRLTVELASAKMIYLQEKRQLHETMTAIGKSSPGKRLPQQQFSLKYAAYDNERLGQQSLTLQQMEAQRKEKIAELVELKQAREGMQKMRAEAKRAFDTEQEKRQQKESDDLANSAFAHKRRNPS